MTSTPLPYDQAFYAGQAGGSYRSAVRIVPFIQEWLRVGSVLDVGCGVGTFLRAFAERGVTDIQGVDGDYVPRDRLLIPPERFLGRDLGQSLDLGRRFDLVMSLEVAEHLPDDKADLFVDNLCRHGSVILFSAAIPEQGGTHHVNEQWPSYWVERFARRGYEAFDPIRPALWDDDEIEYWYRQNCLVFADAAGLVANPRLAGAPRGEALSGRLNLVHPAMFLSKAREARQVQAAISVQATLERLCAEGGAYSFSRNPDGTLTIRRV